MGHGRGPNDAKRQKSMVLYGDIFRNIQEQVSATTNRIEKKASSFQKPQKETL